MSVLCLDWGNSRLKWGWWANAQWQSQGAGTLDDLAQHADTGMSAPQRIMACNVAGAESAQAMEALAARWGVPLHWLRAQAQQAGVCNGYQRPEQLGADRWAALIGARAVHTGPALVVMAGTATTVDILDREGVFQGGLILPGLELMRASLARNTAQLALLPGEFQAQPRNTADAIWSGCLQAQAGAIERQFAQLAHESDACCLLSGGAAAAIAPYLHLPLRCVDYLVLEGLRHVADLDF